MKPNLVICLSLWCSSFTAYAQTMPPAQATSVAVANDAAKPADYTLTTIHVESMGKPLPLRLHSSLTRNHQPGAVIVLFHGGGWTEGEAAWMDNLAQQFVRQGMLAVAVEYRLARDGLTPFDALADARAAIRWLRREAARLHIHPEKIVALGTSAGAHLAAATAVFDEATGSDISAMPNALILRSPAIATSQSAWFRQLVGGAAQAAALSPDLHLRRGLPPSLLLQGEQDNLTPAADAKRFCQHMQALGNLCRLKIYPDVGHLFTRNLTQQEQPDYRAIDQQVSQDAMQTSLAFLRELGFIPPASNTTAKSH